MIQNAGRSNLTTAGIIIVTITQDDNDVICYYSLWLVLPAPCCGATSQSDVSVVRI